MPLAGKPLIIVKTQGNTMQTQANFGKTEQEQRKQLDHIVGDGLPLVSARKYMTYLD